MPMRLSSRVYLTQSEVQLNAKIVRIERRLKHTSEESTDASTADVFSLNGSVTKTMAVEPFNNMDEDVVAPRASCTRITTSCAPFGNGVL